MSVLDKISSMSRGSKSQYSFCNLLKDLECTDFSELGLIKFNKFTKVANMLKIYLMHEMQRHMEIN